MAHQSSANHLVLHFNIHYKASYGDELFVCGNVASLGQWNPKYAAKLQWGYSDFWTNFEEGIELPIHQTGYDERTPQVFLEYKYFIRKNSQSIDDVIWEEGSNHHLMIGIDDKMMKEAHHVVIQDSWNFSLSSPPVIWLVPSESPQVHVMFMAYQDVTDNMINCPPTTHDMLAVGSFCDWKIDKGIKMTPYKPVNQKRVVWSSPFVSLEYIKLPLQYKHVLKSRRNQGMLWENGPNRVIHGLNQPSHCLVNGGDFGLPPSFVEDGTNGSTFHPSWVETGMVGLKNTFASCCVNTVVMIMYHIEPIRQKLLSVTESSTVCTTMKKIFLELSQNCVSGHAKELVQFFGLPEDAQEFYRLLCTYLHSELMHAQGQDYKGPTLITQLFEGKFQHAIKCTNVNYASEREESFYDVSLQVNNQDIQDCFDIKSSLHKFLTPVDLTGSDQYKTPDHGLQDAVQHTSIAHLPPILSFHLKRFNYDWKANTLEKNFSPFVYYEVLDMGPFIEHGNHHHIYDLWGVIVHQGVSGASGHYYGYFRLEDGWYKFNDEVVCKVNIKDVIDKNIGRGDQDKNATEETSHAYLLLYKQRASGRITRVITLANGQQFEAQFEDGEPVCLRCDKKGHIARECPAPKKHGLKDSSQMEDLKQNEAQQ